MSSWKIPFRALNVSAYEVRIWDGDDYDATNAVELVGAEEPIVTEEDSNDDIFTPIRTQSGYIRIIATSRSLLADLMPANATDKKVLLYNLSDDVVEWCGYIQDKNYTQEWGPCPYELELPIISQLGVLDSIDFEPEIHQGSTLINRGLWEISKYLYYGFSHFHTVSNVYFPDNAGHYSSTQGSCTDLALCVARENFFDLIIENERITSEDKYETKKWSYVIENICIFFGWSLRENGEDMYFLSQYEEVNTMRISSYSALNTIKYGSHLSLINIPQSIVVDDNDIIDGSNHKEYYINGRKNIEVTSDPNKIKQLITSEWSSIKDTTFSEWLGSYVRLYGKNTQEINWQEFGTMSIQLWQSGNIGRIYLRGENSQHPSSNYYGGDMVSEVAGGVDPSSGPTRDAIHLISGGVSSSFAIGFRSNYIAYRGRKSAIHITANAIVIKRASSEEITSDNTFDSFGMQIRWGGKYFQTNGTWGNITAQITVRVRNGNLSSDSAHGGYTWMGEGEGLFIPLPQWTGEELGTAVSSTEVEISLYTPVTNPSGNITDPGDGIDLSNLVVDIIEGYEPNIKIGSPSENTIMKKNSGNFNEDYSVDINIASLNQRNNGNAVVRQLLEYGGHVVELPFTSTIYSGYSGDCWAERRLADRIAEFYNRTHRVLEVEMKHDYTFVPTTPLKEESTSTKKFVSICRTINWRDSRETIKMIEL